jgi:hypothetical protein
MKSISQKLRIILKFLLGGIIGLSILGIMWVVKLQDARSAFREGHSRGPGIFGTVVLSPAYYIGMEFDHFSTEDVDAFFTNRRPDSDSGYVVEQIAAWNRTDCVELLKNVEVQGKEIALRILIICAINYLESERSGSSAQRYEEFVSKTQVVFDYYEKNGMTDFSDARVLEIFGSSGLPEEAVESGEHPGRTPWHCLWSEGCVRFLAWNRP